MPPPLPQAPVSQDGERTAAAAQAAPFSASEFLSLPLTKALVGRNAPVYLDKWTPLLAASPTGPAGVLGRPSWNWAAFWFTAFWFLYRKMYVSGGAILVLILTLSAITPDQGPEARLPFIPIALLAGYLANVSTLGRWP